MALSFCSCRGTKPGEPPRPRCPIVLAWLDRKAHTAPRYRCKLGLAYEPEPEGETLDMFELRTSKASPNAP